MIAPRILTFNYHEPYLCMLAHIGWPIAVAIPATRPWHAHFRPVPPNFTLVDESEWRPALRNGAYDVVIAQNEINAINIAGALTASQTPGLLVCHNRFSYLRTTVAEHEREACFEIVDRLHPLYRFVFISESKKADYGVDGVVIPPGIDVNEYGGYRGDRAAVLRVGNGMRRRNLMFDVDFQEAALGDLPGVVVGDNAEIPGSAPSESYEQLLECYRACRCLLHVTREEWEDGYNLSMLEAMACGMPVVSLANRTSPLTNGVDGFVSYDAAELNVHLRALLGDRELAAHIGAKGRETAARMFPMEAFVERWKQVIMEAAESSPRYTQRAAATGIDGASGESRFRAGGYYRSSRPELAQHVPANARRVLDVGCGGGEFGRSLKERGAQEVVGIEIVERAWELAKQNLDDAILGNIETMELPFADDYFDCVVFADVLEHLVNPAEVLRKTARVLNPDGVIIASIPNARFCQVVAMLAHGRWKYEDAGILDRTHLRFFTAAEIVELFQSAGLELKGLAPLSMFKSELLPRNSDGSFTLGRMTFKPINDMEYEDFLVYQYFVAASKPDANPLARARKAFEAKEYAQAYSLAEAAQDVDAAERATLLGMAAARQGQLDKAAGHYRAVLEARPDDATAHGELGVLCLAMNQAPDARPHLEAALAQRPDEPRYIGGLGLALLSEGKREEAMAQLRRSLDLHFDNEGVLFHLVQTAIELGRPEEAEPYARRFVDFYTGNLNAQFQYAALLFRLKRFSEARDRVDTILMFDPGHVHAQQLLSDIEKALHAPGG